MIYYFLIELLVVICASFFGSFFKGLSLRYGLPIAVLLFVVLTQSAVVSVVVIMNKVRKKTPYPPVVATENNSTTSKRVTPTTKQTLSIKRSRRSDSTTKLQKSAVVEPGSLGGPLSVVELSQFKINFELAHPDFFSSNKKQYPFLSNNELWLLAYIELKLSAKEIGAMLDIDAASVRKAKARLNKKKKAAGGGQLSAISDRPLTADS